MRWVKVKVGDVQMKMSGQRLLTGLVRNCGEFFQRQPRSQNFATINISNKSRLSFSHSFQADDAASQDKTSKMKIREALQR